MNLSEIKIEKNPNYGLVVSSRVIANELGKRHSDVLESLDNILENGDFRSLCIPSTYKVDGQQREYKEYLLTKDGFTLYMFNIQGYYDFKMAYINRFNEMEKALSVKQLPKTYKEALIELIAQVEENEKLLIENTELKPKGEFYDAVAGSDTLIDMNQVSKTLNIKGLGRNKLFEFLRSQKILMNDNQPYQQYVDKGYFKLIEVRWTNPKTGDTNITLKTMVFQTGLDFIRKTVKKYYK